MTREAAAALDRIGWSRRDFLETSGALDRRLQRAALGLERGAHAQGPFDTRLRTSIRGSSIRGSRSPPTAASPRTPASASSARACYTAQTQLVAEELSVPSTASR